MISQNESNVSPTSTETLSSENKQQTGNARRPGKRRRTVSLLGIFLLVILLAGGIKARQIYDLAMLVRDDAEELRDLISEDTPRLERLEKAGPALSTLRRDFELFRNEAEPFLGTGAWLEWVPVYGGDLASARDLVALADSLLASADLTYQAMIPLVEQDALVRIDPYRLTNILKEAQPELIDARAELKTAVLARSRLAADELSPQVRDFILGDVDPLLRLFQDGLTVAVEFPTLMGATGEGSQKYLLLVQNEDELRPTGGFITAADTLLMQNGRLGKVTFVNSGDLDNWSRPYPVAPWQLNEYMNSRVLIFRDANWFTDFRTAAMYAEYLYSYSQDRAVDGVIAFDQHLLVELLRVTGPIEVEDVPYLIDADNVVAYMRAAKTPTAEDLASPDWNNKAFLNKITRALLEKILSGAVELEPLSTVLLRALDEHHLLMQLDSPSMTSLLARYGWDGAVRPEDGDFIMAVDTNIGFNKTNSMVESSLSYEVDLTNPLSPTGLLTVDHENKSEDVAICRHWSKVKAQGEKDYPITDCYWNYLRVYTAEETTLLDAEPQAIPDSWMIIMRNAPSQVDVLEEEIDGVQGFGTLQVVPGGQSISASFEFALPLDVTTVQNEADLKIYRLKVQKQPGTIAVPITIRVHLPKNSKIEAIPAGAVARGYNISYETLLTTDLDFEIVFSDS